MTKLHTSLFTILAAALLSANSLSAQQTPAASTPAQAPAATAPKPATAAKPAASAQGANAAKPGTTATKKPAAPGVPLTTTKQKASYAIGMNIGNGLKKDAVDIDTAALARGLKDAVAGAKPALTDADMKAALTAMGTEVRAKQQAKATADAAINKKVGDDFLAANKAKEGVVVLPSGLQYKILKAGTGPKPTLTDKVTCNYAGTLVQGKEFDSSYKRGEPVTFPVNGVIKGWTEALQLMPVGSKWQLVLPPDLGYGDQGAGADIGPKSTLVFEVELLSIAPKTEPAKADPAKPEAAPDAKPEVKPETKPDVKPEAKPNSNR